MEDTTKKKKTKATTKNKGNHDPKWKTKKEGTKTTTKKTTKKVEKVENAKKEAKEKEARKSPSAGISKKTSGKSVNKAKLVDKYKIEKTEVIKMPKQEELDKIYDDMKKKESNNSVVVEEKEKNKTQSNLKKKHYNYLARVATLVGLILLFLCLCVVFIFKATDYELGGSTTYSEYTSNDYLVCTNNNDVYADSCLDKDLDYITSMVQNIRATFNYEAVYSRSVKFDSNYFVVGKLNIFEDNDSSRIRYTKEDVLIDSTKLNVNGEVISFSSDVTIDYASYRQIVQDYINKTGVSSSAELEVALYLENNDLSRKISYINIPLTGESFMITSSNLDNQNQLVLSNTNKKSVDPFYVFVAVVCLLMDILLFTYLINFIYLVKDLDSKYAATLKRILRDYDDYIVNATSDYAIKDYNKVIEVESFDELVDARDSLEKPIVYERVNNIKSRFYVEDDKIVYVYTMKDDGE